MLAERLKLFWSVLGNQLWVRPTLWSLLSVGAVAAALHLGNRAAPGDTPEVGVDTLAGMLTVIASTMLAICTFSLSILYSVFSFVSAHASPRATPVIISDPKAHEAISIFLAAFIFSLVALIALGMKWFSSVGRFLLLLEIVAVIALVLLALLRWLRTLGLFGKLTYTLDRVEELTAEAMREYRRDPWRGCRPGPAVASLNGKAYVVEGSGYVRYVDVKALQTLAEETDAVIHIRARGGMLVHPAFPVVVLCPSRDLNDGQRAALLKAFPLSHDRMFTEDPRFGMAVLAEIAERAQTAEDPGTSIRSLDAVARVLMDTFSRQCADTADGPVRSVLYPRLTMIALRPQDFVTDAFDVVARGKPHWEVQLHMQELLAAIAAVCEEPVAGTARKQAWRCWQRAAGEIPGRADLRRLQRMARNTAAGSGTITPGPAGAITTEAKSARTGA